MKAAMISIQPKWVDKILRGEKTIEVRKTKPNIETPFKCYIYCTKGGKTLLYYSPERIIQPQDAKLNGKVVGEFICDWIAELSVEHLTPYGLKCACLTESELNAYLGNKDGYGWNISDLKVYDTPKEISEFDYYCRFLNGEYEPDIHHIPCASCKYGKFIMQGRTLFECPKRPLTRPPQSWQFVEELQEINASALK